MNSRRIIFWIGRTAGTAALAGSVALVGVSASAQGIVVSGMDITAHVQEATIPGGIVSEKTSSIPGTAMDPVQTAQVLYTNPNGSNFSGRSTNITTAFASSLAQSDGNSGVGVSAWFGGFPAGSTGGVDEFASTATFSQTITNAGTTPMNEFLNLVIPSSQVGLIGVPPNLAAPSATETGMVEARVDRLITHADGSTTNGTVFDFGMVISESQAFNGASWVNFVGLRTLGDTGSPLYDTLAANASLSTPTFTIGAVKTSIKLATLTAGDKLSFVYTLTAKGTTHGGEQGYFAFLGDPFDLQGAAAGLAVDSVLAVPEPQTWALMLAGGLLFLRRLGCRAIA